MKSCKQQEKEIIIILTVQNRGNARTRNNSHFCSELNSVVQNVERLGTYERLRERMLRVSASVNALLLHLNT